MFLKQKCSQLEEENNALKEDLRQAKRIQINLINQQFDIYDKFHKDTNYLIRPLECVSSGCTSPCDMDSYKFHKSVFFLDDPAKCPNYSNEQ